MTDIWHISTWHIATYWGARRFWGGPTLIYICINDRQEKKKTVLEWQMQEWERAGLYPTDMYKNRRSTAEEELEVYSGKGWFHMSILNTGIVHSPREKVFAEQLAMKKDRSRWEKRNFIAAYTNCESVSRTRENIHPTVLKSLLAVWTTISTCLKRPQSPAGYVWFVRLSRIKKALLNTLPQFSGRLETGLKTVQDFGR